MTRLEIIEKLLKKAKANGYQGPDYQYNSGFLLDGTNYYALIFREDFAKAIWGADTIVLGNLSRLAIAEDKWKYLEENAF